MKTKILITVRIISALFLALLISCAKDDNINNAVPDIDKVKLEEAFTQAKNIANLRCLIVWQNGALVKESYFNNVTPDAVHDVRSVTKSIIGLLVGIALEKGFIKSIEQPISEYLSGAADSIPADKTAIKIKHLLTMSGGFVWEEMINVNGYNNWITSANQVQYVLNTPMAAQPGTTFTYNSGALHLLSVIITRAANMTTKEFAAIYLFEPLEIGDRYWQADKQGYYNGGAGLKLLPLDMIKIGALVLNGGIYNGKRIVAAEWINETSKTQISTNNVIPYGTGYGYCWWAGSGENGNYTFANGYGGQFIVVIPSINVIVVATNEWSGISSSVANDQWYKTLTLINTKIIPSFR